MFFKHEITNAQLLPLRLLATLGDAVCSLVERERAVSSTSSAKQMHESSKGRVNAQAQAADLDVLMSVLNEVELELVRRALNLKANNYRKTNQLTARKSTAYEILLGYLYLTNFERLQEVVLIVGSQTNN